MKKILFLTLCFPLMVSAQVGIGTATPQADLDVIGTLRITSDFRPNSDPGNVTQILVSDGTGNPPVWAATLSPAISHIGIAITNQVTIAANGTTTVTITDPSISGISSSNLIWYLPNPSTGFSQISDGPGLALNAAGQWYIEYYNPTGTSFTVYLVLGGIY